MAQSEKSIIDDIKSRTGATHVTKNNDGTYSWKKISHIGGNLLSEGIYNYGGNGAANLIQNSINNQRNKYLDMQNTATSSINAMRDISQDVYNLSKSNLNNVNGIIGNATSNYEKLNKYADEGYNIAMGMTPGINKIDAQGDNMLNIADQLFNLQEGDGLAGLYVSALKAIDPNRYVSMAASDVQNSFQNVQGQMERNMNRQGMSGSGQMASLQKNWGTAMAAALAGAKTKARQQGISEKMNAMSNAMEMAAGMQKQGVGEKLNAVEAKAKQVDVLTRAGQMTTAAAEGLLGSIDSYNKAMGTHLNAAELFLKAQDAAAVYYSEQAEGLAKLAQWQQEQFF